MDVEEEGHLASSPSNTEASESPGRVGTFRTYALRVFLVRRDLWRRAADLEKTHGIR
jgi:pre-mRNA-processing factor 6